MRNETSATARHTERVICSVRYAISSGAPSSPSRHCFAPYASPTAIRTTEMGWWTPAIGVTPGIRRPVRMMTLPFTSSRRMRLGDPTSSLPSGVIVAALMPSPHAFMARADSVTTSLFVARRFSSERS